MRLALTLLVIAPLAVACASFREEFAGPKGTPYQPRDSNGGYSDWSLGGWRFHVEVQGNHLTDASTLRMYFQTRALEICAGYGFGSFSGQPQSEAVSMVSGTSYEGTGRLSTSNWPTVYGDILCVDYVGLDAGAVPTSPK